MTSAAICCAPAAPRPCRVRADVPVASFALVMATGIVSISAWLLGVALVDTALFAISVAAYAVLWLLIVLRLVRRPQGLRSALPDPPTRPPRPRPRPPTC